MHLRRRLPELPRRVAEVLPAVGGGQRDTPCVLDAGQELLGEGEVPARQAVRFGGIRPPPGDMPDAARHHPGAGGAERAGEHDIRVLTVMEGAEDLADHGNRPCAVGIRGLHDDRGVRLLAAQHATRRHPEVVGGVRVAERGDPAAVPVGRGCVVGGRGALVEHEPQQRSGEHGVVRAVVDPAVAIPADQGVLGVRERPGALGERHLVQGARLGAIQHQHDPAGDPGRSCRDAAATDDLELRRAKLAREPPLGGHPWREQSDQVLQRSSSGR